jgi:hypothetical protein
LDLELGELQGEMWGSRHGEFRANTNAHKRLLVVSR